VPRSTVFAPSPYSAPPLSGQVPYAPPPYAQAPYAPPPYGQAPYGQAVPAAPARPRWWIAPQQVRWRIPGALIPWAVLVGSILVQIAVLWAGDLAGVRWMPDPATAIAGLTSYALMAVAVVLIVRLRGSGSLARDLGLAFRPVDLAIGFGGFVGVEIVRAVLSVATVPLLGAPTRGNVDITGSLPWFLVDDVLLAALVAPLVEELMARGLVLRAVRNVVLRRGIRRGLGEDDAALQRRAAVLAVLVSSALFTAAHLYEGWDEPRLMVYLVWTTLPMALVSGWFAIATRRLGAGIVMHVLFNLSASLLGFATLPR